MKYHCALSSVARQLLQAFFRVIGTDFIELKAHFDRPTTFLRLLHYPKRKTDTPLNYYGSAPHVDFGCITLLMQDQRGLQVKGPYGRLVACTACSKHFCDERRYDAKSLE